MESPTTTTKAKAKKSTPAKVTAESIAAPVPSIKVEYSKAPTASPERTHVSAGVRPDRFADRDAKLRAPLDPSTVRTRAGAKGRQLSYIDGFTVIDNANRIFGFAGWFFNLDNLELVDRSACKEKDTGREGFRIAYIATGSVTITETQQTFRDVGYGSCDSYNSAGEAIESATKEAATDCLKRCLRFSGSQFGLSLYDKHSHEKKAEPAPNPAGKIAAQDPPLVVVLSVSDMLTEIRSRYKSATEIVRSAIAEMIADVTIENGYAKLEEISHKEAVDLLRRVKAIK